MEECIDCSLKKKWYFGPYSLIKNTDETKGEECSICLEKYRPGTYKRKLSCGHIFHKKCIDKWFRNDKNECPMCRKKHRFFFHTYSEGKVVFAKICVF